MPGPSLVLLSLFSLPSGPKSLPSSSERPQKWRQEFLPTTGEGQGVRRGSEINFRIKGVATIPPTPSLRGSFQCCVQGATQCGVYTTYCGLL